MEDRIQKEIDQEIQEQLVDEIWAVTRRIIEQHDKVSLDSMVAALEIVKTKHIVNVSSRKATAEIREGE